MKALGVIRRIDELGRIVIPKEIRRTLRIRDGESLEIFTLDDSVVLKKYSHMDDLQLFLDDYLESIHNTLNFNIIATNRDYVMSAVGEDKKKYLKKTISSYLEKAINNREIYSSKTKTKISITKDSSDEGYFIHYPIIVSGDPIGMLILYSSSTEFGDIEEKTIKIATDFISKHIET